MSFCVRFNQIVRYLSGQLAVALVPGSPGHAATLAVVRFEKMSLPFDVNVMFTTQYTPFWSSEALAVWMSSPVSPTSCGL